MSGRVVDEIAVRARGMIRLMFSAPAPTVEQIAATERLLESAEGEAKRQTAVGAQS